MSTKYLVLCFNESTSGWEALGAFEANNDRQAIAKAIASDETGIEGDGDYVATPARSWKPVKVTPTTGVKFG